MTHPIWRKRLTDNVSHAIRRFEEAAGISHEGMKGRLREIAVDNLLRPILPGGFATGTGKIVDSFGGESLETDVILYNNSILPPIMYSDRDVIAPVESCFYSIEVKSRLTATEVRDALTKAMRLKSLRRNPSPPESPYSHVAPVLFAFDSDLKDKTELERLTELDPNLYSAPSLVALCVIGRGYWYHGDTNKWFFLPATDEHDEVLDLLSGIINTLLLHRSSRDARLGHYLMTGREMFVHEKK